MEVQGCGKNGGEKHLELRGTALMKALEGSKPGMFKIEKAGRLEVKTMQNLVGKRPKSWIGAS